MLRNNMRAVSDSFIVTHRKRDIESFRLLRINPSLIDKVTEEAMNWQSKLGTRLRGRKEGN